MFRSKDVASFFLKWLVAITLIACGSGNSNTPTPVTGTVYNQQGPVAGADVTVITRDGVVVGTGQTNASGEYSVSMTGPSASLKLFFISDAVADALPGSFMAKAVTPSGDVLFGVSANNKLIITQLGSYFIEQWYEARGLSAQASFDGPSAGMPVPSSYELNDDAEAILGQAAAYLGMDKLDLYGDRINAKLATLLRSTSISSDPSVGIVININNDFVANYGVTGTINANNQVVFDGTSVVAASSSSAPVSSVVSANVATTQTQVQAQALVNNEHWMRDIWGSIKDRKLADIVIPGTHDSGTYKIHAFALADHIIAVNSGKTQTTSIGEQLRDGIRYFDLRVSEGAHWGCADDSVWWLFHTWDSHRLQESLDEIKTFVTTPGNEKEILILDFQNIDKKYNDDRAVDVLLAMVQSKLGNYIIRTDQSNSWQSSTLAQLIPDNATVRSPQIVVLVPGWVYNRANASGYAPGCNASVNGKYFSSRGSNLRSVYLEKETSEDIRNFVIGPQLQKDLVSDNSLFNSYRTHQANGLLNVIQIVTLSRVSWYAGAALKTYAGYPYDLLTVASQRINAPLNYKMSTADVNNVVSNTPNRIVLPFKTVDSGWLAPYCAEGWFGKRLMMGLQGDAARWNAPNIIIVDNYKPQFAGAKFDWVLPRYDGSARWYKTPATQNGLTGWAGSYVDYIVRLNQLQRDGSLTSADLADGVCLGN